MKDRRKTSTAMDLGFDKCILCLNRKADSFEHIIPHCIGGRLAVKLLCTRCNNTQGSDVEQKLKSDMRIRLAIKSLRARIPEIFDRIENHQKYVAKQVSGEYVDVVYNIKQGTKTISHRRSDGVTVFDWRDALKHLPRMLPKKGWSEDNINAVLHEVKSMHDDIQLQVSNDIVVSKIGFDPLFPAVGETPILDNRIIVSIAYKYLSFVIGELIYNEQLDHIRDYVNNGDHSSEIEIQGGNGRKYDPWHKVYAELSEDRITIVVILFRWLIYKVHFHKLQFKTTDLMIWELLDRSQTLFALTVDDARQGKFL